MHRWFPEFPNFWYTKFQNVKMWHVEHFTYPNSVFSKLLDFKMNSIVGKWLRYIILNGFSNTFLQSRTLTWATVYLYSLGCRAGSSTLALKSTRGRDQKNVFIFFHIMPKCRNAIEGSADAHRACDTLVAATSPVLSLLLL